VQTCIRFILLTSYVRKMYWIHLVDCALMSFWSEKYEVKFLLIAKKITTDMI